MKVKGHVLLTVQFKVHGEADISEDDLANPMDILDRMFTRQIDELADRFGDSRGRVLDMKTVITDVDCGDCTVQGTCQLRIRMHPERN